MGLKEIQQSLNAPKTQFNNHGGYNYRSCEDILAAVKPLLGECVLTLSDEIIRREDRYYVRATATLMDGDRLYQTQAFARESLDRKGMDASQITGAASSYARKYALNGLFAIDDTRDADATNTHGKEEPSVFAAAPMLGGDPFGNPPSRATLNRVMIAAKKAGRNPNEAQEAAKKMTDEDAQAWAVDLEGKVIDA